MDGFKTVWDTDNVEGQREMKEADQNNNCGAPTRLWDKEKENKYKQCY